MPTFRVPITWDVVDPDPDGPIRRLLRAAVRIEVWAQSGRWEVYTAVVDTGASYTMFSATRARADGIEIPAATSSLGIRTAAGLARSTVRDGELRLRFPQLPAHVFRLYCVFSETMPAATPPLLGLNDLLDVFRLTFDGAPRPDAVMGGIHFETA